MIKEKLAGFMVTLLFISGIACFTRPSPLGMTESTPVGGRASCRVLWLIEEAKILKYVEPELPENLRQIRQEWMIYLKADVDQQGRVRNVDSLWSNPFLVDAAVAAVKQWVFEPTLLEGKPVESTRAVEITIRGRTEKAAVRAWLYPDEFRVYALPLAEGVEGRSPKVLHQVDPIYPESARIKGIEGVVAMEALFSEDGLAEAVLIWKSVPELEQAAVEAFSRWVYEPLKVKNKPSKFTVKFHVRFHRR